MTDIANLQDFSIDNDNFNIGTAAILIGLEAEEYIDAFKKQNINQRTLSELSNEDLIELGISSATLRETILAKAKNLPSNDHAQLETISEKIDLLEPADVAVMLKESSKLLNRIKLSLQANKVALNKTKNISDCLLLVDKYASNIVMEALAKMNTILTHMDQTITNNIKVKDIPHNKKKKKWLVGLVGSSFVTLLTICFVKSLKTLN